MTDQLKALFAATVSLGTSAGGLITGDNVLLLIGIIVGLLTIIERIYTVCIKRRQKKLMDMELDRLTGRHPGGD